MTTATSKEDEVKSVEGKTTPKTNGISGSTAKFGSHFEF